MPPPPSPSDRFASEEQRERFVLSRTVVFQTVLVVGGLASFFFLLVELKAWLSPLVIAAAAAVLLWPMREHRAVRSLLVAGGLILLYWLVQVTGAVLLPFALVYLLAYLLDPAVTVAKRRWNVPRWASSLVLTLVAVGVLVTVLVVLVPSVVGKIEELVAGLIGSLSNVQTWIMNSALVDYLDEADLIERAELQEQLSSVLPGQVGGIVAQVPVVLQTLTRSVSSIIALITTVTLIPVLLFYTLRDYPTIERHLVQLFPTVDGQRDYLEKVGHIVGSYLRGQFAISAIAAFNISVFLSIFGAPFPILLGMIGGLLNMIPNVGIILTNVIGVTTALIFGTPVDALVVVLVLFGQQILEATILAPHIMSQQVGLHPVLVILSLLLFGATMGFFGLLVAVPLTALLVAFYQATIETMPPLDLTDYAQTEAALSATRHRAPKRATPTEAPTGDVEK